jgi:hypothetical protein
MYNEPEDRAPRSNPTAPRGRRKGRRLLLIVIPAVVLLIAGFVLGRSTASKGSIKTVVVAASPNPSVSVTETSASPTPTLDSPSATTTDSATATDGDSSSPGTSSPEAGQAVYLSQVTPVDNGEALDSPVDATISNVDYPNSIQQAAGGGNGTITVWDAAQYTTFTAEVGIDDTQAADGQTARIVFMNQTSKQLDSVEVSIGSPTQVKVALNGAVHFEIDCIADGSESDYNVTFGNAQFLP